MKYTHKPYIDIHIQSVRAIMGHKSDSRCYESHDSVGAVSLCVKQASIMSFPYLLPSGGLYVTLCKAKCVLSKKSNRCVCFASTKIVFLQFDTVSFSAALGSVFL